MGRLFYSLLFYTSIPLVVMRLLYRAWRAPEYAKRWQERFGFFPLPGRPALRSPIWVHAVSVGETIAAAPLVKALQSAYPTRDLVVTTMTPTGSERVRALFGDTVFHVYAPYDLPDAMRRFLRKIQPSLLVIMETELWPNMISSARQAGVPVALVNARLSARSAAGYGKVSWLASPMLKQLSLVAAQFQADADRFMSLGLDRDKVKVTGNIKFDIQIPDQAYQLGEEIRHAIGDRRVWIAASTHQGEDELVLQAHRALLSKCPRLLLILVPRHPERFNQVQRLVDEFGFHLSRRSEHRVPAPEAEVFLGDSMGEMLAFYSASQIAFVGGSLVERGGHNPLEPAALGLPVIMGPHVFNFESICHALSEAGGLKFVGSAELLANRVAELIEDPDYHQSMGKQGLAVVNANRGALERVLSELDKLLEK
ncbi:MAG: lipid IV(A) 3-deoxy-D-manno-octulosonic acid transferase [Hahellaceae bacterium]|nr:lipid IV(A) 3-deoxy-D-manno-octulosonic acid transferase [Hahellaceae bacterium]MCP5168652.1 lipid IV(A) 3-deoxy-D-manno-octulosonic acid transferase [Hahellaceae bacterium]